MLGSFVRNCVICQAPNTKQQLIWGCYNHYQFQKRYIWMDISMDFVIGLPLSVGKEVIFVVMD